jgi:hypothetical protein
MIGKRKSATITRRMLTLSVPPTPGGRDLRLQYSALTIRCPGKAGREHSAPTVARASNALHRHQYDCKSDNKAKIQQVNSRQCGITRLDREQRRNSRDC